MTTRDPAGPPAGAEGTPQTLRGADLARAALETARARNAAQRSSAGRRRRIGGPEASSGGQPSGGPPSSPSSPGSGASSDVVGPRGTANDPEARPESGRGGEPATDRPGTSSPTRSSPTPRSGSLSSRTPRGAGALRRTRWSGAGPDRARDPQALGSAMDGWARARGSAPDLARATLFGRWVEVVGSDIAAHASPISLVDGDLLIQAESTAWATQLRLLVPTLVQRINGRVGRGTVRRIRIQGPTGPSWRFGNRSVPGRGQRDTYG